MNDNIKIITYKEHKKASEVYVYVEFKYPEEILKVAVPIEYRRTGLCLTSQEEVEEYLEQVYEEIKPEKHKQWLKEQSEFWKGKSEAKITKSFFDALSCNDWLCVSCQIPQNPNWARRIQDLKEFGYTIATDTNRFCPNCNKNKTHLMLLPIKRLGLNGNGYEKWSNKLRKRIIEVLGQKDVYEDVKSTNCLPDHKFSEIRWDDNTKEANLDSMTDEEIKKKFQLLSNQRNLQKREVCRKCYQTRKKRNHFWDSLLLSWNRRMG